MNEKYEVKDMLGNILQIVEMKGPLKIHSGYDYAPFNQLSLVNDSETVFTYDRLGRIIAILDVDAGKSDFHYNAFGELESKKTPNGLITYKHDALGRITETISRDWQNYFYLGFTSKRKREIIFNSKSIWNNYIV